MSTLPASTSSSSFWIRPTSSSFFFLSKCRRVIFVSWQRRRVYKLNAPSLGEKSHLKNSLNWWGTGAQGHRGRQCMSTPLNYFNRRRAIGAFLSFPFLSWSLRPLLSVNPPPVHHQQRWLCVCVCVPPSRLTFCHLIRHLLRFNTTRAKDLLEKEERKREREKRRFCGHLFMSTWPSNTKAHYSCLKEQSRRRGRRRRLLEAVISLLPACLRLWYRNKEFHGLAQTFFGFGFSKRRRRRRRRRKTSAPLCTIFDATRLTDWWPRPRPLCATHQISFL